MPRLRNAPWLILLAACATTPPADLGPTTRAAIDQDVRRLLDTIALDLAQTGPTGWLPHFLPGDEFFMVVDGRVVFADFAEAEASCRELATTIGSMQLRWAEVRVQPLAPGLATFAAGYDEDLQQHAGGQLHYQGHVTGVAVRAGARWRLQSLHWSSPAPGG
ncbi:MAG: nuclear transport factor 2 family protein [Planctomycetes bacterium]|nr:nuclear transport factor 2 family protein [Planctomycetota bacterium]